MIIFKAYDIRGIYGDNLGEREAYLIGFYFSKMHSIKDIKIARDCRNSSDSLTKYLIQGLIDAGTRVIYLGICSTPQFYFSLFEDIKTGIVVTASHNSKEYNGFKFILDLVSFDSRNGLEELGKTIERDEYKAEENFKLLNIETQTVDRFVYENEIESRDYKHKYVSFLKNLYNEKLTEEEKSALLKINFTLDFSSGVSSIANVALYKDLKLNSTFLLESLDGNFPYHTPDPQKAQAYLKSQNLETYFVGVFDGDGDRISFYDSKADKILQDYPIIAYIDEFSKNDKRFVTDLRVSKVVLELAKEKNLDIKQLRVGRAFYQDYMRDNNCKFGAELSGHFFFRDFNYYDNPDVALIYMLKIVARNLLRNKTSVFEDIFSKYKKYHRIPETNLKVEDTNKVFLLLREKHRENLKLEIDGLSFDFGNYWFNIRKSNTEPVVRINFEGLEKDLTEKKFEELILEIKQ